MGIEYWLSKIFNVLKNANRYRGAQHPVDESTSDFNMTSMDKWLERLYYEIYRRF